MILILAEVTADQDGQTGCGTSVRAGHARTGLEQSSPPHSGELLVYQLSTYS